MNQICTRCDRPTAIPVTVGIEHGGSGAGRTIYACPACAPKVKPPTDALAALDAARRARRARTVGHELPGA